MKRALLWMGLGAGLLLVAGPGVAEACPGCKEALFDPAQLPQRVRAAQGYAWSIGLLLLVPLGLIVGIGVRVVRSHRPLSRRPSA